MDKILNILTFNWHEAYLCMLCKTGHYFDIVERFKGGSKEWFYQTRPLPERGTIINTKTAHIRLRDGLYDAVICHNFKDLSEASQYDVPIIFVFHNKLTTELALDGNKHTKAQYLKEAREMIATVKSIHFVFISQSKKEDWKIDGTVITPGIDTTEYAGYVGNELKVLRIGNFMKKRDCMMGFSDQERILKDIPNTMLGLNEPSPHSRFTESWDDLKKELQSHRVFLNTTVNGYEDGYNLACLEAMATGMPVVSTCNSTSPIQDGYNGYISKDPDYLSCKIKYLFEDHQKAVELGKNARTTVEKQFPITGFVKKWNSLFDRVAQHNFKNKTKLKILKENKKNILLAYVSYPVTTARYIEEALRINHNVMSCGPSITPEIIKSWKLENMKEEVTPQDIPCDAEVDIREIISNLPEEQYPDLFLWIESVHGYFPEGISDLSFPTACYMIDSHMNLDRHITWAPQFDIVFIAQQEYLPAFEQAGCGNVIWLPLGCAPAIHKKYDVDKEHDICFVGSLTEEHVRRKRLLDKLSERLTVHIERSFLEDMCLTFGKSKIVFNEAVKNDLNMRVFEAMATGSLLMTDEAKGSGLTDMFNDREHLIIYNEDNLSDLAEYYVKHDKEREQIARAGQKEVLEKHTYNHRADALIDRIFKIPKSENLIYADNRKGDMLCAQGITLETDNDKENALIRFCESLEVNINNKEALSHLVSAAEDLKRFDIAEGYLTRFIELHPANIDMLVLIGRLLFKQGKIEESTNYIKKALLFDPQNKEAREILQ